jgi:hypothetical protein
LRRSFSIAPGWWRTSLAALATEPDIEGPAPTPEPIAIERHGGFFRVRTPAGQIADGTLPDLAARIDRAIMEQGFRAEIAHSLLLPAAILRAPAGERCAFIGARASGKTWLSLSLIEAGWRFECDGWAVAHGAGLTPLPRTIRIVAVPPHLSPALRGSIEAAPTFSVGAQEKIFAVDPRRLCGDWRLESGPAARIFFLELNPGGLSSLRELSPDLTFGRALAVCRGRPAGKSLIALHRAVCNVAAYRLRLGGPADAADLLEALMVERTAEGV